MAKAREYKELTFKHTSPILSWRKPEPDSCLEGSGVKAASNIEEETK